MAVYKRGRVYWYDFRFNGARHHASCKTRNAVAAKSIESKVRTDLAMGLHGLTPLKAAPTLDKFAVTFREHIRAASLEETTIKFYEAKLLRLLDFKPIASAHLNLIDEEMLENYTKHRRKTVNVGSVILELATLRRLLRYAWKVKKLIPNVPNFPALTGGNERTFVLTQTQESIYLAMASALLHDFGILALDTGVRVNEGLRLEWENVTLEPIGDARLGSIYIPRGKSKNAKRTLSLTPRVKAMLETRRRLFPATRYVFESRRKPGTPIVHGTMDRHHEDVRDAAKTETGDLMFPEEFVVHSLRHTFGTRLGEANTPPYTIMRIMGHASIEQSQRYVHPTPDGMERAFEQLDAMNRFLSGNALEVPTVFTTVEELE